MRSQDRCPLRACEIAPFGWSYLWLRGSAAWGVLSLPLTHSPFLLLQLCSSHKASLGASAICAQLEPRPGRHDPSLGKEISLRAQRVPLI